MKTMKDDAAELSVSLKEKYGDKIGFTFVDVTTSEIDNYPGVKNILPKVRLPLTAINGEPRLHGGLDQKRIEELIASLLA